MDLEKLTKKKLIEIIKDYKRREWEYLQGEEKDYSRFLLEDFNKKQDELELRNEQMADIQDQLEDSREKYFELFDNAPVGYLTLDDKGKIQDINYSGCNILGFDQHRVKNLPLNLYVSKESTLDYLVHINETRKKYQQMQSRFLLRNGKYVQVITTPGKKRGKLFFKMVMYDITEIRKAEQINEFFASIVENSQDAIYTRTLEGEIKSWNTAAAKMYGYTSEEILKRHITIIYPEFLKDEYHKINKVVLDKGSINLYNTRHITKDRRIINVSASFSLITEKDTGSKTLVSIVRDISMQTAYEDQLRKSIKEKDMLLKEIHHRVKNNLQIISSLLNLQKGHLSEKNVVESFVESQNRIRAMAMVHEKLYLSGNTAQINIRDYIQELTKFLYLSYPLEEKQIRFYPDIDDELTDIDTTIDIGLIINELMTNALKYAFEGMNEGSISLSIHQKEDLIEICFADNGRGMPEEKLYREDSLGLTIVRSLVEQNNGKLKINNNSGTEFFITL
jgi:PAS domain S-box-containing protein